jgi:hypothetical protein
LEGGGSSYPFENCKLCAPKHEHKLFSLLGVNVPELPDNWFWRVGSVTRRFYCLKVSSKGYSLEKFPTLLKKNKKKLQTVPLLVVMEWI